MTAQLISTLPANLDSQKLPRHIAVIMDGNGRWATRRGLPRVAGHRRGAQILKQILRCCRDWGISVLTAYAFSTENWNRPHQEVDFLMSLFESLLRQELKEMHEEGVCLRFLGDLTPLPDSLQREIKRGMAETKNNQGICLNVAINYGSRQEIVRACRYLAELVQQRQLQPEAIDENLFQHYLYTADTPDPDLLIRTSGEMRLSNFLLWQMAYGEIYVTKTLWPDFSLAEFYLALGEYQGRERRFGQVPLRQGRSQKSQF